MVNFTAGSVLTASALNTAFNTQTIDAQTGTTFTFGTANSGELVTLSNASGGTATIPPNSTYGAATGTVIGVMNAGTAGSFVIAAGSGVTLNAVSGTTTLAPLEAATLVKLATNTWQLSKGGGLPKATYSSTTGSPTVTTVSGKTCVQFTGSGSITNSQAGLVEVLVVGGGGGGGQRNGGGGGAGGHLYSTSLYVQSGTLTVTVGAGGAAGTGGVSSSGSAGLSGQASGIGTSIVAPGGGGGGNQTGGNGGSGGGGVGGSAAGGTGYASQGNDGGQGGFKRRYWPRRRRRRCRSSRCYWHSIWKRWSGLSEQHYGFKCDESWRWWRGRSYGDRRQRRNWRWRGWYQH